MPRSTTYYHDLLKRADAEKSVVVDTYNRIMEYVLPYGTANTQSLKGNTSGRTINSDIQEATSAFKNFVMYALFGIETNWAKSDVVLAEVRKKYSKGDIDQVVSEIKAKLDVQTNEIFQYIRNSNYKQEVGRAIFDWGELGVGCYKIIETDDDREPFYYQYIPLNEYTFMEDYKGRPSIVVRKIYNKSIEELTSLFPNANFKTFIENQEESFEEITVTEIVTPYGKDKFEWVLFDDSIENILDKKILNYNPFTIFRFNLIPNSCFAIGIGVICLDVYERIVFCENLRARQALRIVDPPLMVEGDIRLTESFDLTPNGLNYAGDGMTARAAAYPINTTGNLLPLEQDIARYKQTIQKLHFSEPFGNAENKTTRAVNEIQYRMQLLQQKFSDAVNNLFAEVLIPSFDKPRAILLNRDIVARIEEEKVFKPQFVNTLTKSMDSQEVEKLMSLTGVAGTLFPQEAPFIYNTEKTLDYIVDKLGVNKELISSQEDRNNSKKVALATAMQSQALGGNNGE